VCSLLYRGQHEQDIWVAADFFVFHRSVHAGLADGITETGGGQPIRIGVVQLPCAPDIRRDFVVYSLTCELWFDCQGYQGGDHWVNSTSTLDKRTIFAVMGVNKDLSGQGDVDKESIDSTLRTCEDYMSDSRSTAATLASAMVYAKPVYGSLGLSMGRETLEKVAELAQARYYENPDEFIASRFGGVGGPNEKYGQGFPEQDSMINRLLIELNQLVVMPRCPRAFHAGFVGYNREHSEDNGLAGDGLRNRYSFLEALGADEMKARSSVSDVWPAPLQVWQICCHPCWIQLSDFVCSFPCLLTSRDVRRVTFPTASRTAHTLTRLICLARCGGVKAAIAAIVNPCLTVSSMSVSWVRGLAVKSLLSWRSRRRCARPTHDAVGSRRVVGSSRPDQASS
jgi:hypothetical protein